VLGHLETEIGEERQQLLQLPHVLLGATDDPPAGPVADDVVGDDRRDVLQIGRCPELGEQVRSPAGCEEFFQPGFAFAGDCHFGTSRMALNVDFTSPPTVPTLGALVDYLLRKAAS
jgi:hypothetical protein